MILFIQLKIILLKYFSIFGFNFHIQTDPKHEMGKEITVGAWGCTASIYIYIYIYI